MLLFLLVILYLFDFIDILVQIAIPEVKQLGVMNMLHPLLLEPLAASLDIFGAALADLLGADQPLPRQMTITGKGQPARLDHLVDQRIDQ